LIIVASALLCQEHDVTESVTNIYTIIFVCKCLLINSASYHIQKQTEDSPDQVPRRTKLLPCVTVGAPSWGGSAAIATAVTDQLLLRGAGCWLQWPHAVRGAV
jgi:hypothetical protein